MAKCTIVTIWNNKEAFRQFQENLADQIGDNYTILPIENANNQFPGARQAYNAVLGQIDTEYVIFAHQDIRFFERDTLEKLIEELDKLGEFGVVGVAGCPAGDQWQVIGNIVHGQDAEAVGPTIETAQRVQSGDECLYVMKNKTVQELGYSDLEGWHLYAVEQCIRAEAIGLPNYVVPIKLWHLSKGNSLDPSYLKWLKVIQRRYSLVGLLNTTIKPWEFGTIKGSVYIYLYYWKQKIKQTMKKMGLWEGR